MLVAVWLTASVQAQVSPQVTFTVNGNKDLQLSIDGINHDLRQAVLNGTVTTIAVYHLNTGQHKYILARTLSGNNRTERVSAVFYLRNGYDLSIQLNEDGSLALIESKNAGAYDQMLPMQTNDFNNLLNRVKSQKSITGKKNVITKAFNAAGNFFSSNQVYQLLQQITAESSRLQLAKISYDLVTDKGNFYKVFDVLQSQSARNELETYVQNYNREVHTAMTDANFNSLYQTIQQQWPSSTQVNSISNAFNNTSYYFTTAQARKLILLITGEANRLQLAKLSYRSITDRNSFYQLNDVFSSQSSKDELANYVNNYTSTGIGYNQPITDANFNSLYQTIQQQWPLSTQVNSISNAFNNTSYYFTTAQARKLILLITGEANRLQLAKLSYRSITDRNYFYQLNDVFSSQSSKDELAAYINQFNNYGTGTVSKTAMPDASFQTLYQTLQLQFFPGERMSDLTTVFSNVNNFFTSAQAKMLIQLVAFESNRLQLAKLSYRTITDRENFSQLYELLDSQSNRDELDAYVKKYNE